MFSDIAALLQDFSRSPNVNKYSPGVAKVTAVYDAASSRNFNSESLPENIAG